MIIRKGKAVQEPVIQFLKGEKTNRSLRAQYNPHIHQLTSATGITNVIKNKETIMLFYFGKGQIFGEERFIVQQEVAPYTAICHSYEAEIFRISSLEFQRKIMTIKETMKQINRQCMDKVGKIK